MGMALAVVLFGSNKPNDPAIGKVSFLPKTVKQAARGLCETRRAVAKSGSGTQGGFRVGLLLVIFLEASRESRHRGPQRIRSTTHVAEYDM